MPSTTLAIDGGAPLRTRPFGPRWVIGEEERRQVLEVIDSADTTWRSRFKVQKLAEAFAERHGVRHAIPTSSGTGAVHTAVAAIDPEPGSEIITTPVSDIGSVLGIMLHNAVPIFADWDPQTFNMDPADVERRITEHTSAILAVHLFGAPCDMDALTAIGHKYGVPIIEDTSQAHLAEYKGRLVGGLTEISAMSIGGKTLTTDQGGVVLTDDDTLARRAMGFSRKGSEVDLLTGPSHQPTSLARGSGRGFAFLGDSHAMTDMAAAVGLAQLDRWDEATRVRRSTARILDKAVEELPGFLPQKVPKGDVNTYCLYVYTVDEAVAGVSSECFAEAVRAEGIPDCHGPYLDGKPLYRYPLFTEERTYGRSRYPFVDESGRRRVDYAALHLPNIERVLPTTGRITLRNTYTEDDAQDIAAAMKKVALSFATRRASVGT